ncbi:MAG: GNAT family N-acetyltransferase [Pseudomonadales bacterium]|nr:GNAT family N-acetyltransferase [Pseudomonadales bacterium]NIX07328.1 GNAT family N-acetyltransferase [Pseudomonadales bacterium]
MPTLTTERLVLRPLECSDISDLHEFWNDPEVRRYLWEDQIMSRDAVAQIVADSADCFEALGTGFFAIEAAANPGALVGFCGHREFEDGEQVELLFGIVPEFWGEGFGTEAATEVLRHGFESCGIHRVIAATETPNQRSVRVLQRLGMSFEERRKHHGLDTVFYSLTREVFASAG